MTVLLRLGKRPHWDVVLLQPARDCVGVAPTVGLVAIDFGDFNRAQLFADVLRIKPVVILIEGLCSQRLAHD